MPDPTTAPTDALTALEQAARDAMAVFPTWRNGRGRSELRTAGRRI